LHYQCPYSALISEKLNIQFNPSCPIKRELGEIIKLTRSIELRGFEARIEFYKKKRFLCEEILIDLRYESLSLIVQPTIDQSTNPPVEGRGHRVVEERISTSTIDLEEDSSVATYSTAWPSTMETDIMDNEILIGTMDYKSTLEVTTATTSMNDVIIYI